jgi:ribonuclease P protein component
VALTRALRLRKNSDFQQVRQQGRVVTSRLLILAWRANNSSELRIGFVVGKRISKHAVTRNYIKRLLSEAIRPFLHELSGGWDVVLSAKYQILGSDIRILEQDIGLLLRKARLLTSEQSGRDQGPEAQEGQER